MVVIFCMQLIVSLYNWQYYFSNDSIIKFSNVKLFIHDYSERTLSCITPALLVIMWQPYVNSFIACLYANIFYAIWIDVLKSHICTHLLYEDWNGVKLFCIHMRSFSCHFKRRHVGCVLNCQKLYAIQNGFYRGQ